MPGQEIHFGAVTLVFVMALLTIVATSLVVAPYGRHARRGWGPAISTRLGWVVMESPAVIAFSIFVLIGPRSGQRVPQVLAVLWLLHYVDRTFIYSLRQRARRAARMPIVVVMMGFSFNIINAFINGASLSAYGPRYPEDWFADPRFVCGAVLFALGFVLNRWADYVLRGLRADPSDGYKIPAGGMYRWISCPNYLGEILLWIGWAIATWSWAGAAFAVFTIANLAPRARAHHRWYRETFADYPRARRALIPALW